MTRKSWPIVYLYTLELEHWTSGWTYDMLRLKNDKICKYTVVSKIFPSVCLSDIL